MAELPPGVRERTDALDALGNTTAATGKGFAIGSAVLTALALLSAFTEAVGLEGKRVDLIADPEVLPGTLSLLRPLPTYCFDSRTLFGIRHPLRHHAAILLRLDDDDRRRKGSWPNHQ